MSYRSATALVIHYEEAYGVWTLPYFTLSLLVWALLVQDFCRLDVLPITQSTASQHWRDSV